MGFSFRFPVRWSSRGLLFLIPFISMTVFAVPEGNNPFRAGNRELGWRTGQKNIGPTPFLDDAQPVFSQRCVTCHGCYGAPCQANFQNYGGVWRGFNSEPIFSARRLNYSDRLFPIMPKPTSEPITKDLLAEWSARGFHPVLDYDVNNPDKAKTGLIYTLLEQGQKNVTGFSLEDAIAVQKTIDADKQACIASDRQFNSDFFPNDAVKNRWGVQSFSSYSTNFKLAGMPFGLYQLDENTERKVIQQWLEKGAPGPDQGAIAALLTPRNPQVIADWEDFLNGYSYQGGPDVERYRKSLHAGRYIYEHMFSASIYFEESPGEYYELVRSSTRQGLVQQIKTATPVDPVAGQFYYRFRKITGPLVQKSLVLWKVSNPKLAHLKRQFLFTVWKTPVPEPKFDANVKNPFVYFKPIPAMVRSRFLLENSKTIVAGMTQGSVCVGSQATYAINDHFAAWFLRPESDVSVLVEDLGLFDPNVMNTAPVPWKFGGWVVDEFVRLNNDVIGPKFVGLLRDAAGIAGADIDDSTVAQYLNDLRTVNVTGAEALGAAVQFVHSVRAIRTYQAAYERQLRMLLREQGRPNLDYKDIWTGGGFEAHPKIGLTADQDPSFPANRNPNARLVITRHETNASVQYGPDEDFNGGTPQSRWVMSYSNFERLYYNLVGFYEPWGSVAHKLRTWQYMMYVRVEGEDLAISFLPVDYRPIVRERFAKGIFETFNKFRLPQQSTVPVMWGDPPVAQTLIMGWKLPFNNPLKAPLLKPRGDIPGSNGGSADESIRILVDNMKSRFERGPAEAIPTNWQAFESGLLDITGKTQAQAPADPTLFPSVTYIRVTHDDGNVQYYTVLVDAYYKGHDLVFGQDLERDRTRDSLSLYRGLVGGYPNLFLNVGKDQKKDFLTDLKKIRSQDTWDEFFGKYAVKRNEKAIWDYFDDLHVWKGSAHPGNDPVEQGIVDMSRYKFISGVAGK